MVAWRAVDAGLADAHPDAARGAGIIGIVVVIVDDAADADAVGDRYAAGRVREDAEKSLVVLFDAVAEEKRLAVGSQSPADDGTQKGTQNLVQGGQSESSAVHSGHSCQQMENGGLAEESQQKSAVVRCSPATAKSSAGRTRTYIQPVNSRLLHH